MEAQIEKAVSDYAEKRGLLHRKYKTPGRRNAPDRIYFGLDALTFFIEFKNTGKKPRPGQLREARVLQGFGFDVHFVDNVAEGKAVIDSYVLDDGL